MFLFYFWFIIKVTITFVSYTKVIYYPIGSFSFIQKFIFMKQFYILYLLTIISLGCNADRPKQQLTSYVNPLLGTATLWEPDDLGYTRTWDERTWGAEVFPGSSLPNAMVQLSPVTQYRSGAGYQYEDTVIYGFAHTNKGHWNLLHLPILPVTG